jgi:Pathogenicity locus
MNKKEKALMELRTIPGIGKSIANDLWNIGIKNVNDLTAQSPQKLYGQLNRFSGVKNDICLLYTFRCAVYYATETDHEKEKLKWWYWKDKEYID